MTTTDREKDRKDLVLVTPEDRELIEQDGAPLVGIVEPPPPYHAGPRRKLPGWVQHLRDLRHLKLVE